MIDPLALERWLYRLLYVALAAGLVFVLILPLETRPGRLPGPDWMLCLTFAWVQRRPDYLPAWLIAAVFLMMDMLLMRPPGLLTALALLWTEFLRSRQGGSGDAAFGPEWLLTGAAITGTFLAQALILGIFAVASADFARLTVQAVLTVLAYPLTVVLSRYALGVHRAAPGALEARGGLR